MQRAEIGSIAQILLQGLSMVEAARYCAGALRSALAVADRFYKNIGGFENGILG